MSWRAEVCVKSDRYCPGVDWLWLTDDQSPSAKGYTGEVTAKGYDTTTGVGVPNGQAFIRAIRKLASS